MTVTSVDKDPEAMTLTFTAEFDEPLGRVWRLWEDPRQLERWWGPPTYPATVVDHDLTPGGSVSYFMTGPQGDQHHGWWRVTHVDAPHRLEFENGLADETGAPSADMPSMIVRVAFSERPNAGTRMQIETAYPSLLAMEKFLSMGMEEGMTSAVSQIDAIL